MNADKQQKTVGKPFVKDDPRINREGRPKEQTLKEYVREWLKNMTLEERKEFLSKVPKQEIWKMAEGLPKQETDVTGEIKLTLEFNERGYNPKVSAKEISEGSTGSGQEV